MDNSPIPAFTPDLLAALDERFPHRCPRPTDSDREIWMAAGRRSLVDFLLQWQDWTTEQASKPDQEIL